MCATMEHMSYMGSGVIPTMGCVLHGHWGHTYGFHYGTCPTWTLGSYLWVAPWDVSCMDTGVVSMGPTMGRVLHGQQDHTSGSQLNTGPPWAPTSPQTRPYEDTGSFPRVPPQTRTSTPEGPPVPLGAPQAPSPRGDSADLGPSGGTSIGACGSASAQGWGRGDRGTPGAAGGAQPPSQHSGGAGVLWGHGWHRCPRVSTQSREHPRGVPFIPGAVGR